MPRSAIAVYSGGLDSTLAIRLLQVQGIQVHALHFTSPFFGAGPESDSGKYDARRGAAALGVELTVHPLGNDYLEMLRNPRHGHGRAVNPCIDCHAWMFRIAAELMRDRGADFVVSGEVLGQRPMSQRREPLQTVARDSGLDGLLLRPLSARLLPPTIPELEGWVDRERLPAISGRARTEQLRLAAELGVTDYPTPAGGCLLTELSYAGKIRDLFVHEPLLEPRPFRLLRLGRHFRLGPRSKVIIGRNQAENAALEAALAGDEAELFWADGPGPMALVTGPRDAALLATAARLLLRYTKAPHGEAGRVQLKDGGGEQLLTVANDLGEAELEALRIQ